MLWFWLFVGPALLLALLSLRGERRRAEYVAARMAELGEAPAERFAAVTLIVPVGGASPDLAETLRSLAAQDYPDYEMIVATPDADSIPAGALPPVAKVALAGIAGETALLQAGVRGARRNSEIFAFARPEGVVSPFWLRALVAPLPELGTGATTGFRWYAPERPAFWPLSRSIWNGVIAGRLEPEPNDFAWEGAMAISKDFFIQARVNEAWNGAARADFALAHAVRFAERAVTYAPGAIVALTESTTARQYFREARREMAAARRYFPRLWWTGLITHTIYCGAMVASVVAIARGSKGAEWALVIQFGLGMLKGVNRATLAKAQLPQFKTWFDSYSWTHTFWVPLTTWFWLYILIASAFDRERS